jgi:DNA repair exonuclease SbcCD ATPase subunit
VRNISAELRKIAHGDTKEDTACQVDLPSDPVTAFRSIEVEAVEDKKMAFSEVHDIHESDYKGPVPDKQKVSLISGVLVMPPPTQRFEGVVHTFEGQYSSLPPRPVSKEVLEQERDLRELEVMRLKLAQEGVKPVRRQTWDQRSKQASEQLTEYTKKVDELQQQLEEKDKELEEMQAQLDTEQRDKQAQLALGNIKLLEDKIKAMEDEALDDDDRVALILARNKELYAEIDLALSKKDASEPDVVLEPPVTTEKKKSGNALRPNVIRRPVGFKYSNPTNRAALTKRISSAFQTAEKAIHTAAGTKKLVPAVLTQRKKK